MLASPQTLQCWIYLIQLQEIPDIFNYHLNKELKHSHRSIILMTTNYVLVFKNITLLIILRMLFKLSIPITINHYF